MQSTTEDTEPSQEPNPVMADDSTVYPGDYILDDRALLAQPRSQREMDLEAWELYEAGFTVRQIAQQQKVHHSTAYNRMVRGRELGTVDPLRAVQLCLPVEMSKLRRMQRHFLEAACGGNERAAMMVLRIQAKLESLSRMARQQHQATDIKQLTADFLGRTDRVFAAANRNAPDAAQPSWDDDAIGDEWWVLMREMLPGRIAEIDLLQKEFQAADRADQEQLRKAPEHPKVAEVHAAQHPPEHEKAAATAHSSPAAQLPQRPLTRKERKRQKWARNQQRADAAQTERRQGAGACADSQQRFAAKNGLIDPENALYEKMLGCSALELKS